jgi:hypothetical protein
MYQCTWSTYCSSIMYLYHEVNIRYFNVFINTRSNLSEMMSTAAAHGFQLSHHAMHRKPKCSTDDDNETIIAGFNLTGFLVGQLLCPYFGKGKSLCCGGHLSDIPSVLHAKLRFARPDCSSLRHAHRRHKECEADRSGDHTEKSTIDASKS